MHNLYEFICDELKELEKKADSGLSMSEIQLMDTLLHAKKNLLKAEEMEEESEYSGAMYDDGMSYERGGNRGNRGSSYRGTYRGSYARGRGRNARRDSMGRYSSDGYSRAAADMTAELQDMMDDPKYEPVRHDIERLMRKVEQM